ncbi:helix-turn-helix domain-containing protein [Vibrio parahaemolyticus]
MKKNIMNIVKTLRIALDDTQPQFAARFRVSVDTVKSWESGRRNPSEASLSLMTLLANHDDDLKEAIQKMHPHYRMADEILEYLSKELEGEGKDLHLRFVIYGESGSGKTRIVNLINEKLAESGTVESVGEIAECIDLIHKDNLCKALGILKNEELRYANSRHIAFSVLSKDLASSLEANGIKVFRL